MSRFLKHFAETNALIFDNDKSTISSFFALKIKSTYSGKNWLVNSLIYGRVKLETTLYQGLSLVYPDSASLR